MSRQIRNQQLKIPITNSQLEIPMSLPKPKLFRCPHSRLWKCVIDNVQGTGTTRRYAYSQWKILYGIIHPKRGAIK